MLTGPREEWTWRDLDDVGPSGSTPTADGVRETAALLDQMMTDESLLVVVTDGKPNSVNESVAAIEDARERGQTVLGIGFGTIDERNLRRLFGDDSYVATRLEDLADALVETYSAHLNIEARR